MVARIPEFQNGEESSHVCGQEVCKVTSAVLSSGRGGADRDREEGLEKEELRKGEKRNREEKREIWSVNRVT